jgi:hypothetical protein
LSDSQGVKEDLWELSITRGMCEPSMRMDCASMELFSVFLDEKAIVELRI